MAKNEAQEVDTAEAGDAPLIDLNDASIRKLIARAKKRGFITIDELNEALPQDQMSSEQIEDIMSAINDMGINVVEAAEDSEDEDDKNEPEPAIDEEVDPLDDGGPRPAAAAKKEPTDRTDDPVRMYLREMGSVELLSREGEIAIAKRIEAGREIVIAGLCESPLTFQAIIIWRDELNEGKVLLRDIIDLDATYGGPDAKAMPMVRSDDQLTVGIAAPNQAGRPPPLQAPTIAPVFATPLKPAGEHSDGREMATERMTGESNLDDEEMENWLSD